MGRLQAGSPERRAWRHIISIFPHWTEQEIFQIVCTDHAWLLKAIFMIWTIAVILFVLWLLGFGVFHVAGGLIHLLLVIAVVVVVYQLITGRRSL